MATVSQKFVLVGPHRGKTMSVNGHQFTDGEFVFVGSAEQVSVLTNVFRRYAALPEQVARLRELEAQVAPVAPVAPAAGSQTNAGGDAGGEPGKPTLAEAIGALDPEVDSHWTSNNLPSLEHLGELTGRKVARGDVDAVAEGYTRAKARAARQQ